MQNPYDVNTNASNALMGGAAADNALGFPNPRPQAGMRTGSDMIAGAKARLDALRAQRAPAPQPAVFGYNPENHTFFSGGKTWSGDNLTDVDNYDKAGYFDLDNNGKLPEGYSPVTADYVRAWKDKKASERGFLSAAGETLSAVGRGVPDIINMGVQAAAMNAPAGSWLEQSLGDAASEYQRTSTTPDVYGRGETAQSFIRAGQAIPASVAAGAASVAAPVIGTGAAGYVMGSAQAWDTYQRGLAAGLSPEEAKAAALKTGTIEGVGETLADAAAARLLPGAGKALTGMMRGMAPAGYGKRVAIDLLANAGVQSGTEFAQGYGQAAVERKAGISTADPFDVGSEGFKTGLAMSALMAPFGVAAGYANRPQLPPPAPAQPAAPEAPAPSLATTAPVGTQGELLDAQQGPVRPAPVATPESYQEKVASLAELTSMLPEAQEVGGEYLQDLQAQIRAIATQLVSLGDNSQNQRGVMSGVNEIVSGVPTELTNDELVSGAIPMVDAGFDPQQSMFNFDQPTQQEGLVFEPTELPTAECQQAPKRKTKLTPDEMSYEGQQVAFSNTDYVPQDTDPYSETKLASAINPNGRLKKRMPGLVKELYAATSNWNEKAIEGALRKIEKADPDIFMAADQLVNNMRQERTNNLARQGQGRAQPGQAVGNLPAPKADTVAQMRAQSQQTLADETAPDYTPNEMDPGLVKEKGPKGPASTLALRGQTQADLDALNTREQWLAGPQENTGPGAVPANQLAMFDLKGQPTKPAMGVPLPQSEKPEASAPKRGPKSRKPTDPKADQRAAPSSTPVASEPSRVSTDRKTLTLPAKKPVAAPVVRAETVNSDLTTNVPDGPLDAAQQRMMSQIDKAYEADQIEVGDIAPLQELVRAGRVPQARAKLSELAISNVGAGRARFRQSAASGALRKTIDSAIKLVEKALGGKIQVVVLDSVTQFESTKRAGSAAGAYKDGKVYVFMDGVSSLLEAQRTIFHELFHRGARKTPAYQQAMRKLFNQSAQVRAAANAWMKTPEGVALEADKTVSPDEYLATAVDEALAETAEQKATPSTMRMLGNWLAAGADAIGLKSLAQSIRTMRMSPLEKYIHETVRAGMVEGATTGASDARARVNKDSFAPIADTLKYDVIGAAKRAVLSSSFLRDLGERYAKSFTRVSEHVDAVFKMSAKAGEKQKVAADVSAKWQNLSNKETEELSSFMADVTLAEVHVEGDTKGLTKEETAKRDALRAQFEAMSEPQKAAYRSSRDALKADWAETARLLGRKADEIYAPLIAKAKAAGNVAQEKSLTKERNDFVADINARVSTIRGDYFPLSRFGQWSVVRRSEAFKVLEKDADKKEQSLADLTERLDQHTADQRKAMRKANRKLSDGSKMEDYTPEEQAQIDKAREEATEARALVENAKLSEDNYYVAQFDRESQAQAHARQMDGSEVVYRGDPKARGVTGVSRQMLDKLDEALESQLGSKGLSSAAREAQRSLYQIYLSSLPETSALKRQMKRTGIAGFNKDMHRNVVSSLFRNSFYLSRLEHADEIGETLRSVSEEARLSGKLDLQRFAAELDRRHVASMEFVDTPVQDKVSAISYLWFLGASPAFLITNLLQPGMVTAPMLQSRHGVPATMKAMGSAYKQTFAAVSKSFKSVKEFSVEASGLDKPHKDLLNYLMENRLLDVTMAHDLAIVFEGGTSSKWIRRLSNPSHYAELVNRISSGIAAYDLEYARTRDSALAQRYAAKVLADTHLDYSSENAPYWMKPGVVPMGKLLFQFKKYQLGMLSLMIKNIAALARKEDRKEAMGMLAGVGVTHMAMAGSMGLPVAGTAMMVFQMIASAFDDEPRNVEAEYRNWLNRTFGKDAGTALAKGLPAAFGVDMSQKVGLGSIAKPATLRDSDTKQGRDLYLEVMAAAAGPSIGGLFSRPFEFYDYAANGEMSRAAQSLLPKMVGDVFKGARYAEEGVMTRQGRSLADAGGLPLTILMAMGFPLTHVMDTYAANASKEGLKAALDDMSSDLRREWVKGSPDDRAALQRSLPELNQLRISYGLRPVTMGDLYRHQQQMRTGRKMPEEIKAIGEFAE